MKASISTLIVRFMTLRQQRSIPDAVTFHLRYAFLHSVLAI